MLAGTQNVADAFALYFRRLLSFKKLAEAKDRIQRRAQFVAHPGEKFAFSFAGALYLVHQFALRNVLHGTEHAARLTGLVQNDIALAVDKPHFPAGPDDAIFHFVARPPRSATPIACMTMSRSAGQISY